MNSASPAQAALFGEPTSRVTSPVAARPVRHQAAQTQLLFCEPGEAARNDAIEQLHAATAIYTAQPVVDDLLNRLGWPCGDRLLLDPSCGDGMFLVRALERLLERGKPSGNICRLVQGWEIHPGACSDARNRVTGVLMSHGYSAAEAGAIAQEMVTNRDFLTHGPTEPMAHFVAGNPPYLRNAKVPALLREEYAQHVPDYASADLMHSFLERCSRAIYPDGKIGFVTCDRWLINLQSARLREKLGERLSLGHLERLDVNSAFYRPKSRRAGTPPRIHPVSVVLNGDAMPGRRISADAIYPGVDARKYEGLCTLDQFARVRIAPWLGSEGIFVVNSAVARTLPEEFLVPCVDTDDIEGGRLKAPTRFAIRTSPDVEPPGVIMDHLNRNMHRMAERGRKGKPWMPPESFHKWDLSAPSLIVPRIMKAPKAVRLPANTLPINHNLSVVAGDMAVLDAVETALASDLSARWVAEHAPRLENSYFSLVTTQLRQMPVEIPMHLMR